MKTLLNIFKTCTPVCALSLLAFASCSVDDKYDMSKEIDMTVGIGAGVSLPNERSTL